MMNEHYSPTTYMTIEASETQPETTRPAKPRKSRLFLIEREQEEGIVVFIFELFKDSIKDNIFVQNTFNLILAFLKYQERLENNSTFRETKTIEIGIQRNTFREKHNELADRIIGLN
jgi:hypothetical protein